MGYEVINNTKETIIIDTTSGLKVCVNPGEGVDGTAFCQGTLYAEKRSYVPRQTYVFQGDGDAADIRKMAVFFFVSWLDTELYIVEIPRNSALFPQEAQRIFGSVTYERAV
ncbi:hypothetical protein GWR56_13350 [Mucilaginibacter sp. 14171R-50]|uniref:hypothetical protein n=1 Tax=Mucilaginibacter sp. 14171R-50 TaxID=2703789 RepID=UPI00138CE484|nr:hypothetical protein [Mucilaginibacter sp. 14171R-50]QHS56475.1 hypothetical protein GWR56_13350 [Mucilaginibacter sp. 14171R-50]